ncbi:MAG: HPr family phosphocarrier protein [Anaerolineales bacterium]|jgi:phosphocarrier protein HPr
MKSINITVQHKVGLHARPAALFVQTAQKHEAKITVTSNEKTVNAKSLLGLLGLGVTQGTTIHIEAQGADEEQAVEALKLLVESNFGV